MTLREVVQGAPALSVYLPCGTPDLAASQAHFEAAIRGGAAWLEVGIPFSDPAADGPVIEEATQQAVAAGIRLQDCLALARRLKDSHPAIPLVAMTYANVAHAHGFDDFARMLKAAGIDGCILADVPLEESGPVRDALATHEIAWVPLVTPTTDPKRMRAIAKTATGFLYVVGNVGTTGQEDPGSLLEATVARARAAAPGVPLAVGFGIASPQDVARVHATGAHAIVGSRIVRAILEGASPADTEALVKGLLVP